MNAALLFAQKRVIRVRRLCVRLDQTISTALADQCPRDPLGNFILHGEEFFEVSIVSSAQTWLPVDASIAAR